MRSLRLQRRKGFRICRKRPAGGFKRQLSAPGSGGRDTCRSLGQYDGDGGAHLTLCPPRKSAPPGRHATDAGCASSAILSAWELPFSTPCDGEALRCHTRLFCCREPGAGASGLEPHKPTPRLQLGIRGKLRPPYIHIPGGVPEGCVRRYSPPRMQPMASGSRPVRR